MVHHHQIIAVKKYKAQATKNKSSGGQIAAQYSNPRNEVTRIGASIAALFHHNTCLRSFSNVKFIYPLPFDIGGSWRTPFTYYLFYTFKNNSITIQTTI